MARPQNSQGVIGPQHARQATGQRQSVEDPRYREPSERAGRDDGDGFRGCVIDDGQALQHPSISRAIKHEVC